MHGPGGPTTYAGQLVDNRELLDLETALPTSGSPRLLRRQARTQVSCQGLPVTGLTVARRACDLLTGP